MKEPQSLTTQKNVPFAPWPHFAPDEIEAASEVLASGKVNQWTGHHVKAFEAEFAAFVGVKKAVAVANGTLALEGALRAIGIGPGDEVVVPARTFIATASAVAVLGATPVVADVDAETGGLSAETIRPALTERTKAVIPVHLAGWPCDMDPILQLAEEHDLRVIEDCAQAHGATYKGRPVGSMGDLGCFSFCQDKIMTTGGEGGMIVTDHEGLWARIWSFKDHGKDWSTVFEKEHPPGFRWLHEHLGTNHRMTEMQAAIGRIQLQRLPDWARARQQNAQTLIDRLQNHPAIRIPLPPSDVRHAYYKFYAVVNDEALAPGWDRDRIMSAVTAHGVPCYSGSCSEIHLEKAFQGYGRVPDHPLDTTRRLGAASLMFLVHPTLSEEAIRHTADVLLEVLDQATTANEVPA